MSNDRPMIIMPAGPNAPPPAEVFELVIPESQEWFATIVLEPTPEEASKSLTPHALLPVKAWALVRRGQASVIVTDDAVAPNGGMTRLMTTRCPAMPMEPLVFVPFEGGRLVTVPVALKAIGRNGSVVRIGPREELEAAAAAATEGQPAPVLTAPPPAG